MTEQHRPACRRRWFWPSIAVVVAALAVLLLEGVLSLTHMIGVARRDAAPVPVELRYVRHDARLGWAVSNGVGERDGYGAWRTLHTNADGLRADHAVDAAAPDGVGRIACVGGSAVFGVAVGDDETWCRRLGLADADFETVNLGQPGHGPGQSLMHYRARSELSHDIVLFVLDDGGLERLLGAHLYGFPKPRLDVGESGLEASHVPVPRSPYWWPWATANRDLLASSHLLDWLLYEPTASQEERPEMSGALVMDRLLKELAQLTRNREVQPALVYLPGASSNPQAANTWRRVVQDQAESLEIPFLDLTGRYRALPEAARRAFFHGSGLLRPFAHVWIAAALERLLGEHLPVAEFDGDGKAPWIVRYYPGPSFAREAGREHVPQLALEWGVDAPRPGLAAESFGAVADACLALDEPERVRVMLEANGSAQLVVNGQTVLDTGEEGERVQRVNTVALPAGVNQIRVRYANRGGAASVRLMVVAERDRARVAGPDRFSAPLPSAGGPVCADASRSADG